MTTALLLTRLFSRTVPPWSSRYHRSQEKLVLYRGAREDSHRQWQTRQSRNYPLKRTSKDMQPCRPELSVRWRLWYQRLRRYRTCVR